MTATVSDHELLGVRPGVGADELRRAFRRRAFELHPDRNPSPRAAEAFLAMREAYERLASRTGGAVADDAGSDAIDRVAADLIAAAEEAQRRRAGVGLEKAPWQRLRVPLAATLRDRIRRQYSAATWAAEAHAGGLDDLRWDVRISWAEVAEVALGAHQVALTLTPTALQRVATEAPLAVSGASYVLPTHEPERLAAIIRRRAGCE